MFLNKNFESIWRICIYRQKRKANDYKLYKEKARAELILFSYPVYTFIVPTQLHRFIELMKKEKLGVDGKYMLQITTSKHFYDITAQRYVEDNCRDMGMRVFRGFSADMEDLLKEQGRRDMLKYWKYVNYMINKEESSGSKEDRKLSVHGKDEKYRVVIVTDCAEDNEKRSRMIIDFRKAFPYVSHVVNLRDFEFKGGLACLKINNIAVQTPCHRLPNDVEY